MPFAIRSFLALMLLASVGPGLAVTGPADASTTAARLSASTTPTAAAHTVRRPASARGDGAFASARKVRSGKHHRAHAHPRLWKQRTLYYYDALPAKWDWSLSTAVAKWNASGAKIRFVRIANRHQARLTISYAAIGSRAGEATVGPMAHPRVRLSSYYRHVDENDAVNRVEVMAVLAHELGHVLGFHHTSARCGLMSPVLDVVGCGMVGKAKSGYYRCRTISQPLVTQLVRKYGGRARAPAGVWCLIDPMPPVLHGVTFTGGDSSDAPATVGWAVPRATPPGSVVRIRTWSSTTCGAAPAWATTTYASVPAATWRASDVQTADQCFDVELVNRYGVGRQAVAGKVVARAAAQEDTASAAG